MSEKAASREFGTGPLARASALVYTLLVTEGLFLLTTVPGLVPLLLLDHDASNLPLDALCLLPVGPAASAALFALHRRQSDLADLQPGGVVLARVPAQRGGCAPGLRPLAGWWRPWSR